MFKQPTGGRLKRRAEPSARHKKQGSRQESAPRIINADGVAVGTFVTPPTCQADAVANYAFTRLRFFDTCASYSMLKKGKLWQAVTAPYTSNASKASSHERAFLNQLFAPEFTGGWVVGDGKGQGRLWPWCNIIQWRSATSTDTIARAGVWSTTGPPSPDWPGPTKAERVPISDLVSDV